MFFYVIIQTFLGNLKHTILLFFNVTGVAQVQGGAVNRGLIWFFQCKGNVLLKLVLGPKSTGWCAGLLANHLFSSNFISISGGGMAAVK